MEFNQDYYTRTELALLLGLTRSQIRYHESKRNITPLHKMGLGKYHKVVFSREQVQKAYNKINNIK